MGTAQHLRLRRTLTKERLEKMKAWMEECLPHYPPKSPMGKALRYPQKMWPTLDNLLDDPKLRLATDKLGLSFSRRYLTTQQTATGPAEVPSPVRIIHPFHPRVGQEIDVVVRRAQWGEDRVFYRTQHGHLASLPACWTSFESVEPFVTASAGRARLRVTDLLELVAIREESHS